MRIKSMIRIKITKKSKSRMRSKIMSLPVESRGVVSFS